MKKTLQCTIVLILTLAILSPSVLAAGLSPVPAEDTYLITTGSAVYYTDETGDLILENQSISSEMVSASDLTQPGVAELCQVTKQIPHSKTFGNSITMTLTATFNYEAGESVTCIAKNGQISYLSSSLTLNGTPTTTVTQGSAGRWCRVTYTVKVTTSTMVERTYAIWIECTSGGVVNKG